MKKLKSIWSIALRLASIFTLLSVAACTSIRSGPGSAPNGSKSQPIFHPVFYSVAISPDGETLAAGAGSFSAKNTVYLWSLGNLASPPKMLPNHETFVHPIAISPDSKMLASGTSNTAGLVRLWNLKHPDLDSLVVLSGTVGYIEGLAFSPDGHLLASGGGEDQLVRLWDLQHLSDPPVLLHGDQYSGESLSFSLDGSRLAAAEQESVRVWNMNDLKQDPNVLSLAGLGPIWAVAFSPDGTLLAAGGVDRVVRVWQLGENNSFSQVAQLVGHTNTIRSLAFSPKGDLLASSGTDATVRLWTVPQWNAGPSVLNGHVSSVNGVAFTPDGTKLASASGDGTVRVWDVANPSLTPVVLVGP